jgi:hypothetical protein
MKKISNFTEDCLLFLLLTRHDNRGFRNILKLHQNTKLNFEISGVNQVVRIINQNSN